MVWIDEQQMGSIFDAQVQVRDTLVKTRALGPILHCFVNVDTCMWLAQKQFLQRIIGYGAKIPSSMHCL